MAGLARRIAPAAALGGLAVVIVGLLDPALAGREAQAETPAPQAQAQAQVPAEQPQQPQQDQSATTSGAGCSQGTKVTGTSSPTPWGPVQVVGTVADGKLCEAHAVAYPVGDRKSAMINSYAIPELDAQVAQGATQIDFISGATYTSNGYALSLQSILDQL